MGCVKKNAERGYIEGANIKSRIVEMKIVEEN